MTASIQPKMETDKEYVETVEDAQPSPLVDEQRFPSTKPVLALLVSNDSDPAKSPVD
jgi:hypothetical protein